MDEITLTLTSKDLDIVANALGMRPYVEVAQLLQKIGQQVQAQQHPAAQTQAKPWPEQASSNGAAPQPEPTQ